MCRPWWFLDAGSWSKTAAVRLYFIFHGNCTLSLVLPEEHIQIYNINSDKFLDDSKSTHGFFRKLRFCVQQVMVSPGSVPPVMLTESIQHCLVLVLALSSA
ncbi:hypothetical protein STEG23_004406 [Scotinomys teguina]